jgi:hypothetical protein
VFKQQRFTFSNIIQCPFYLKKIKTDIKYQGPAFHTIHRKGSNSIKVVGGSGMEDQDNPDHPRKPHSIIQLKFISLFVEEKNRSSFWPFLYLEG